MKDVIKIRYSSKTVDEFKEAQQSYLNFYINIRPQKKIQRKNFSTGKRNRYVFISVRTVFNAC